MYVRMFCQIAIQTQEGTVRLNAADEIRIDKSIDRIGTTASFQIPTSARLNYRGGETRSVQTAKVFNRGDAVTITLGYDDRRRVEFSGFIHRINFTSPLEVECEGYDYLLRDSLPTRTFASTTLKDVLGYIISGKGIKLAGDVPQISMTSYVIPANLTGNDALQQLKELYGLTIYFSDNTLYAGLDFIRMKGSVNLSLGYNTLRADELQYQLAEDVRLKVKAVAIGKDNTRFETEIGDREGEQRTLFFYNVPNVSALKELAKAEIAKHKFTGYTGRLTTFLEPHAEPGMVARIEDKRYPERGGSYEIRGVSTTFSTSGARRVLDIGKVLSDG